MSDQQPTTYSDPLLDAISAIEQKAVDTVTCLLFAAQFLLAQRTPALTERAEPLEPQPRHDRAPHSAAGTAQAKEIIDDGIIRPAPPGSPTQPDPGRQARATQQGRITGAAFPTRPTPSPPVTPPTAKLTPTASPVAGRTLARGW
ncbi:hypothetical protein E0F15_10250 [Frankia sp. B2]|uniref:hypothetical protein n=1 Tax=unclassified Frankia TaxID=2632575 RepID=UPI0004619C34|nr:MULTISPECIES: hypothetical protein [unclassified Frankia]KDA40856.1 hypothetical protein BMG523Draft_04320 [Frankia sp. BMG5.23]TFE31149.1 hypothetical protein E0F15_10250 [Frankia sp. B2]